MSGYWNAHSDLDWYYSNASCGFQPDWDTELEEHESEQAGEQTGDDRKTMLRLARDLLERVSRHEHWGCSAMAYADAAADYLRRAGLHDLAAECADEFGIDVPALLWEIDAARVA